MKLIIFTYAPAGLGHLRVTDALASSRPKDCRYVLLGSYDEFLTWAHRFTSINPIGKFIFLSSQYGILEDIFTYFYKGFLISTAEPIYKQILDVITQYYDADEIQIVATHFGMAHQIGAIKERLIKETGRKIRLVVQVTDDTYQHIWLVKGADLTIVPSAHVKKKFEEYAKEQKVDFVAEVVPYPVDDSLTRKLPLSMSREKTFENINTPINVMVPVSGAAAGLPFTVELISELVRLSSRFKFFVLIKKTPYTDLFVAILQRFIGVHVTVGKNDNEMINLYELIYLKNLIHLEITKPSEQAFKAIVEPDRIGGSVLLFSAPVGRQEFENIEFLRRHNLLKNISEVSSLGSANLRALVLGSNVNKAAVGILNCISGGVFKKMLNKNFSFSKESIASGEVGAFGADMFWVAVEKHFG